MLNAAQTQIIQDPTVQLTTYSYMAPFSSTYIVHKIRKTEAKTHCFNFLLKIGRQIKNRLGLEGEWCLLGIEQKFC